jgi:tripartite-type tricarboxylate transporter receptor subunit TctC
MMRLVKHYSVFALPLIIVLFSLSLAMAQTDYPRKDITVIMPWRAGGGYDITSRMLAPYIEKYLPKKVNLIVKNVLGAGGRVGCFELYDAAPDGYTIGMIDPQAILLAEAMGQAGTRNPLQMTWLGRAAHQPFIITLSAANNLKTVADVKGKPIRVTVAALNQAGAILMLRALGAKPQIVLFDSSNDGLLAAARGEADASCYTFATSMTQVEAMKGKLIPGLVGDKKRHPDAPDVPVPSDLGLKIPEAELAATAGDYVMVAPPKVPPDIQKILADAIWKAMNDKDFVAQMDKAKYMPNAMTAEETLKLVTSVREVYAGLKPMLLPTN